MIDTTINLLVNRTECTNLSGTTLTLRLAVKSDNSSPAILFRDSEKLDATIKLSLTLPTESTDTMDNPTLVQPAEQEMPLENEGAQHNEHEIHPKTHNFHKSNLFQFNKLVVVGQLNQLNGFWKVLNKNNQELLHGRCC